MPLNFHAAQQKFRNQMSSNINTAFKELLETKHLYQNVEVKIGDLLNVVLSETMDKDKQQVNEYLSPLPDDFWYPLKRLSSLDERQAAINQWSGIYFDTPDVSLFCKTCKSVQAHNNILSIDFLRPTLNWNSRNSYNFQAEGIQDFVCSFLCQKCKSIPETFIVRRIGFKLTLSGRSLIEHVEVPKFIPKLHRKYFSGAILAQQSGQTLAGNFLLRTFIEQWERSFTGMQSVNDDNMEAIHDNYKKDLPDAFKSLYPSLSEIYDKLSVDIHSATGSPDVFVNAKNEIIKHFDARRLSNLPDKKMENVY